MRVRLAIALALLVSACSGQVDRENASAIDEAPIFGLRTDDAGHAGPPSPRSERVRLHGGGVLATMHVQIVYVGVAIEGGAPSRDDVVRFTVTSGDAYWGLLHQYGVDAGHVDGAQRISRSALLPAATAGSTGTILPVADLEARIHALLHPTKGASVVPKADGYLFFLPDDVNVSLGSRGSKVFTTCIDVGAYHRYDGAEPYAVFPPCELGRSARAISHELAEMATDPIVGTGWLSDTDQDIGIGEIADLCNVAVESPIGGFALTELWSNADGRCMPASDRSDR
jgi:hypothetical protein